MFASVGDPDLQKQLTEADAAAALAMNTLKDYLVSERRNANDKFAFGGELFAQMLKDTEQVDIPVDKIEALGRADLERNTAALRAECTTYAPQGIAGAMRCEDGRQQAQSRSRRRSPQRNCRCSRISSSRTMWLPFRAATKYWLPKLRPTIDPTRRSSTFRDPMTTAWHQPTTSRRPIPSGARRSKPRTFPAKRRCCSPRYTKCGPDTSCSSCMQTQIHRSSKHYGWDMPSPKVGPITAKR